MRDLDFIIKLEKYSMNETFDIKESIRDELKKNLVFRLQSRLPIGVILGFVGYRNKMIPLMQVVSQTTRAFIVNSDGLPGFV